MRKRIVSVIGETEVGESAARIHSVEVVVVNNCHPQNKPHSQEIEMTIGPVKTRNRRN